VSIRRVGVLLRKEFVQGPKNFIFIYGVVAPLVISLVLSLVLGSLFSEEPRLGIVDEGGSELVALVEAVDSLEAREFDTAADVKGAVAKGAVDVGVVLPRGFDAAVRQSVPTEITAYIWGESLAKSRAIVDVTLADLTRDLAGQEAPVTVRFTMLGKEGVPWEDRMLPFIMLIAVVFGGAILPATSLVGEKQGRTLEALVVTPTSLGDVFLAKGLVGVVLSFVVTVLLLAINQAFGSGAGLLLMVLVLGAVMAAGFGLLLGAAMREITTLFAVFKMIGVLLYAPSIIYLFPQIPQWIGKIFPTYYLVQPVVEISQRGGGWADIAPDVGVLIGLDVLLLGVVVLVVRKAQQYEV